jgi:hypothetical protein
MAPKTFWLILFLLLVCVVCFYGLKQFGHPSLSSMKYNDYISVVASLTSVFVAGVFILEYCLNQRHYDHYGKVFRESGHADLEYRIASDPDLHAMFGELYSFHPDVSPNVASNNSQKLKEIQIVMSFLRSIQCSWATASEHQRADWKRWFRSPIVRYHYNHLRGELDPSLRLHIEQTLLSGDS